MAKALTARSSIVLGRLCFGGAFLFPDVSPEMAGEDTTVGFWLGTSETSTALPSGSSSFLSESPGTRYFDPEALPGNYLLLTDSEIANTVVI